MGGSFLGGAKDRLLPASIPFRFFLSAAFFHVLAWATLFAAASDVAGYSGGLGPVLAAIHLATLGVFTMTAVGASYQLLPVVTRRALARVWVARLSFWILFAGICLMTWGMGAFEDAALKVGAVLVSAGLLVFAAQTADNLRHAGVVAVVAAHGWAALVALVGLAGLGLLLIWNQSGGFLSDPTGLAFLHAILASFGFMGFLVLGFSLVLVPMFVLARSPDQKRGWLQLSLAALALISFLGATLSDIQALVWLSLVAGFGAISVYLWQMRRVMKSSMRKRLGLSFWLIRASWGLLPVILLLGMLIMAGIAIPNAPALFGFLLLAGWLLTFLTGILQRIMPFLASMHAAGPSGMPPLLSELTAKTPLKIHAFCHFFALLFCACGIVLDNTGLVRAGAGVGAVGALAFLAFAILVVHKLGIQRTQN